MPAARHQDALSFLVEWYDPLPQLTKQYLLKYHADTNEAEMVDIKTRRLFLKRSPCPQQFTARDFALGSKVILYGRDLTITAYADQPTEEALVPETESAAFLIGPDAYSAIGKVLDELVTSTKGVMSRLKMVRLDPPLAAETAKGFGLRGQAAQDAAAGFVGGAVVFGAIRGNDVINLASQACGRLASRFGGVLCSSSVQHAEELERLFEPGGPVTRGKGGCTATFDSCTCCVIKPHAVKAGSVGKIVDHILTKGYDVSALETFRLNRTQAQEFFEVYQGVIPQHGDLVDEMTTGTCVALEVRGQNAVKSFRETAGPWDVDMAKELRPTSIRGTFGEDAARTGVHCTDLPEDGPSECRYFFELLQGV